ncbi:hypothetical protein [Haloarcula sp. CGMCC 1.2071]|uniref:hypothetical protein n=1 Tax=Haloarcula sp. CGMCC 1.2071 TaxID=3111454 RepID=UPI00300F3318
MAVTVLQLESLSITSIGSLASIIALVIALIARRHYVVHQLGRLTGKQDEELKAEGKSEFLDDLFGSETEVELIEDGEEYGRRISKAAEDAVKIRRLSGNLEGQKNQDDYEAFCNPNVEKHLLVMRPEQSGNPIGKYTGNELIRHLKTSLDADASLGRLEGMYHRLKTYASGEDDWENVTISSYWHTPWIRMAIYEDVHGNREAGFTFSPSVVDFRDSPLFWTEDSDLIAALNSYYDDIWTDERTVDYTVVLEELKSKN